MSKDREFQYSLENFQYLKTVANQRSGIVVEDDKFDMFYSRIARRVRSLGLKSFDAYCDLIKNEKEGVEVLELINSITTNLTAFFREKHHFEFMHDVAIPEAIERNHATKQLRIWSAGCSTGEEPYSLAMTLIETIPDIDQWNIQILATDIDSNVLNKASNGIYAADLVKDISKERLKRFFQKGKAAKLSKVRVKDLVKKYIKFGKFNLIDDWEMPNQFDVIFCRNVIIYFDKETKRQLISQYAKTVVKGGYLCIGHSESLYRMSDDFDLIGKTVYQRNNIS